MEPAFLKEPMRSNRAFWRSLHSLTHPVSFAAIVVLLFNDHFLRLYSPSWLTGKLGDFAWLVFAPFLCAAVLAWLFRGKRQEAVIGLASVFLIGLWFALAKTTLPVHRWTLVALQLLLGYSSDLHRDVSDLLALPALFIAWRIWLGAANTPDSLKSHAGILVALGTIATVATSVAVPVGGIVGLRYIGGKLTACAAPAGSFVTEDGGLTWKPLDAPSPGMSDPCMRDRDFALAREGTLQSGNRIIRYSPKNIESSSDGGKTWTQEMDLSQISTEARQSYYRMARGEAFAPGPYGGIIDSGGNVILAMGLDGVLVRTPEGTSRWVTVGSFQYLPYGVTARLAVLRLDYFIAAAFAVLAGLTIGAGHSNGIQTFVVLVWLFFALTIMPFTGAVVVVISVVILTAGGVIAGVSALRLYRRAPQALLWQAALSAGAGLAFLFPYVLWATATVPDHEIADIYALGLGIASVIAARRALRRQYPEIFG